MFLDQPLAWTNGHWPAVLTAGVLVALLAGLAAYIAHRTSSYVLAAGIGALVCTAFSADTSWRFAGHTLHMEADERLGLFAAGEITLIVFAIMARANKLATATDTQAGTPGVPGVLVWCIAGVQLVPAFAESGLWGGLIRSVFGPLMASMLWHLAMGLEVRLTKPEALSTGLPAQIGHELRERLLSHLGLATRNRTAEEITRDRAHARVVRLGSRRHLGPWGRARLAAAVARSRATVDGTRRHLLLQELAGRRTADQLRTMDVTSPWVAQPLPEPYPSTPLGVTGAELRRMDPVDAVLHIHAAHPGSTPAELASLATEYGVTVSETLVGIALRAAPEPPTPVLFATPTPPQLDAPTQPQDTDLPGPGEDAYPTPGLQLYLTTTPEVPREVACAVPAAMVTARPTRTEVHARVADLPQAQEHAFEFIRRRAAEQHATAHPEGSTSTRVATRTGPLPLPVPGTSGQVGADEPGDWNSLIVRAREVDADHRHLHGGRPASVQTLKTALRVGQPKAQRLRDALAHTTKDSR